MAKRFSVCRPNPHGYVEFAVTVEARRWVVGQFEFGNFAGRRSVAGFAMPKSNPKDKPKKEKRDFAQTAFAVFQKATGIKQSKARHSAQRHSRSGRGR
jgi:hypothetical protein